MLLANVSHLHTPLPMIDPVAFVAFFRVYASNQRKPLKIRTEIKNTQNKRKTHTWRESSQECIWNSARARRKETDEESYVNEHTKPKERNERRKASHFFFLLKVCKSDYLNAVRCMEHKSLVHDAPQSMFCFFSSAHVYSFLSSVENVLYNIEQKGERDKKKISKSHFSLSWSSTSCSKCAPAAAVSVHFLPKTKKTS